MTRYDAILLIFGLFFTAFAGYFVYREYTDPILFPGGQERPASVEPEEPAAPTPETPPDPPESISPGTEPAPPADSLASAPSVNPEELQSSVEEALTQQVGQLAALMETRLASTLESAQDRVAGQFETLESANQIIRDALTTYQENTRLSTKELSDTLGLIDEMRDESESITSGLENARAGWDQLFEDVAAIDERSDDRLDEANFAFQTYTVGASETLSGISRRLEAEYNLPESDLSFLLNRFNDIEYRFHIPGGRRPSYRVVANETLRVPVPKTAGTILQDYALPEKLRSQIDHINKATAANANLRKNLSRQVEKLKQLEANVQAIASMSETLAQIDLDAERPLPDDSALSPELQDAWQQFENAASAYRSATDFEKQQLAGNKLQQSIARLLEAYERDYLNISDPEADPLEFYLRFIEKYRPGNSGP